MAPVDIVLLQFKRQLRRRLVDKAEPVMGNRECHHHLYTVGPPGLRFLEVHVGSSAPVSLSGRQSESFGCSAFDLAVHLVSASHAVSRPRQPREESGRLVASQRTTASAASCKGPSKSPCSAPRSSGIGGGLGVSNLPLLHAWEEENLPSFAPRPFDRQL